MAAIAIARKNAGSILSPATRGGSRLWHAPLPSRNRFAVHGADSRVPPSLNAWGDGRWSASGWAWAPYSSQQQDAIGSTHGGNAGSCPGQKAMWRALLDIRAFAERLDDRSARQGHAYAMFAGQQKEILGMLRKISFRHKVRKALGLSLFSLLFLFAWLLFYIGAEHGLEILDEFLTTRVNKIVTDLETQKNIRSAAILFTGTVSRRFNPWYMFTNWITGGEDEAPEMSNSELVSRDTFLALAIILLLQVNHDFGSTAGELMENLKIIGMKDPQKNLKMLELLEKMGYVETCDTFSKKRGVAKSYWASKSALNESTSGLFERKMRKLRKAEQNEATNDKKA